MNVCERHAHHDPDCVDCNPVGIILRLEAENRELRERIEALEDKVNHITVGPGGALYA